VTVSTADIPVLHSAEIVHFYFESYFSFARGLKSPKHYQGEQAGYTMKPFKGSSNKLGPLGFQLANRCRAPLLDGMFRVGYAHIDRGRTIPDSASPLFAP
jgi:hypothetical protein